MIRREDLAALPFGEPIAGAAESRGAPWALFDIEPLEEIREADLAGAAFVEPQVDDEANQGGLWDDDDAALEALAAGLTLVRVRYGEGHRFLAVLCAYCRGEGAAFDPQTGEGPGCPACEPGRLPP
jgi:hypothetical protein